MKHHILFATVATLTLAAGPGAKAEPTDAQLKCVQAVYAESAAKMQD